MVTDLFPELSSSNNSTIRAQEQQVSTTSVLQEEEDYSTKAVTDKARKVLSEIENRHWRNVQEYIGDISKFELGTPINSRGQTLLHIATETGDVRIVEVLVQAMNKEDLKIKDKSGNQPLILAAAIGYIDIAEVMLNKDRDSGLANIENDAGLLPVIIAVKNGNKEMTDLLYSFTDVNLIHRKNGPRFLVYAVLSDMYDIVNDVVGRFPELAFQYDHRGRNVLTALAKKPLAFPSGSPHKTWVPSASKRTQEQKLVHKLLKTICGELSKMNATQRLEAGAYKSILKASKYGIVEMVRPLTMSCPDWNTLDALDEKGRNVFQIALLYRQEQVFNLIYDLPYKNMITNRRDKSGNNFLHMAGSVAPPSIHNRISGAALIMQRELQWFKEVEGLVPPKCKTERNNEQRTPRQVFTENHKEIVQAGEIWMKDTSEACMVVAALIATVGFTSALTIPGGNYETILPVFRNYWYFQVFILTDALSLLCSLSSTLMFLAILTSRFAEEDFHHSLPQKMILGLVTLFSSIVFMIICFSSALFLIFRHNSLNWLPLVSTVFIAGPIYLFVRLQISLLVEMICGTYGPSIFGKKKDMGIRRN